MTTARRSSRSRSLRLADGRDLRCSPVRRRPRTGATSICRRRASPSSPSAWQIELDLTPGIAIAPSVLAEIDRDRRWERRRRRSARVRRARAGRHPAGVDGRPLPLELVERAVPHRIDHVQRRGHDSPRLTVAVPPLAAGGHRISYRNDHRRDIAGVSRQCARSPRSDRVAVHAQRRSVDQRDIVIEYDLDGEAARTRIGWFAPGLGAALFMAAAVWFRRTREVTAQSL